MILRSSALRPRAMEPTFRWFGIQCWKGTLLLLAHLFRLSMTKSIPNLKFSSSTVNVSSIFQGPANTLYCRLRAAAYFSPIFSQASCLLKRKAVYLRKRSNTTLRGLMIAGAATQGTLKTTQ